MRWNRFGMCVVAAASGAALGVPRETATFTNVDSIGTGADVGDNETRAFTFAGGYFAARVRLSGTLLAVDPFTWQSDPRIAITGPGQSSSVVIQPFATGQGFTTASLTDAAFVLPAPLAAAGEWNFRFYELIWDSGATADARWQTISFTLDDEAAPPGTTLNPNGSGVYTEVEDNDSKIRANRILSLQAGQSITGVTQGVETTPGVNSADYFRIRTAAAVPLRIYQHRLVLTSATAGHVGSIRGLAQLLSEIQNGTDVQTQGSTATTSPARMNQWYGFGKQEDIYYRVAGTAATTAAYSAAYSRTSVTPLVASRNFASGTITISSAGQGHTTDTDLWLYDSQLSALPGLGNDDVPGQPGSLSVLTANLTPGDYYVAIAPYNLANHHSSPTVNEDWTNGNVMDFADCVVQDTATLGVNVSFSIADSAGTATVAATRAGAFEVVWVKFTVSQPACPADVDGGAGNGTPDGAVTIDDLLYFLIAFEQGISDADLDNDGDATVGVPDGAVTIDDLVFFLARFEAGC
jgi:hypothetical protein